MLNQQHTDWRASGTQFSHFGGGATGTQFSHLGGGGGLLGRGARDTLETLGYWDATLERKAVCLWL